MAWTTIVFYIIITLYVITVIGVMYTIIMENRSPVRTLAWMLVLSLIPGIGLLFYIYFGMNYRRIKMFSMKGLGDFKWLQYMSEDQKQRIKKTELLKREDMETVKRLMTLLLNNSKALLSRNNTVDILNNGEETFKAIFLAISKAKKYIHLEYYIIEKGELGERLKNILIKKATEGVEVRVIYDDVGSWKLPKSYIREMQAAGIQIYPFLPVRFPLFTNKVNYRNHRKIVVVDGEVGFLGGLNFADRYLHGLPGIGIWRDTHLKVRGEAVTSLQVVFLIDWYFVRQELLLNKEAYLPNKGAEGSVIMQAVSSGPDSDWTSIQQAYFTLINMAKKYVFISTPYFMPGETTINSLKTAAMSGVDVRIMIPYKSDSLLTYWCTRSYVEELLEAGVRVFRYRKGFNHSKLIIIDGLVSSVGTANMDIRSFEQNFELNMIIYDRNVSRKLATDFINDLKGSGEISIQQWKFRPKKDKIKESLARLFAPLL
ncbi:MULTISPECIES: cardiolipin synthase [Sanguibacteroides]|uniref:Cardiolipin synthase n=1 Tax=Sanguibacteroides justesenii TaxID=1547597 RepID=A0A0C3MEH1_9PORP|nr:MULTISPECIES: cardiolipin synthase [Sanguibacteroides]KIO43123.1 cardiolipin synthetase [Sanguibacteroides justesenii]KIO44838.1 cardiolipin synthetase [Sanguibacteroides justesenii]PXZ43052.1 cardiolipin synthase [Sanguibacteroides justesenii]